MIKISKKLALSVGFINIFLSQFVAIGSIADIDQPKRQISLVKAMVADQVAAKIEIMNQVPRDIWKNIFEMASAEINPADLQKVCACWRNIVRENRKIERDNKGLVKVLTYEILNPFLKGCADIWQYNEALRRFKNGRVCYTPKGVGHVIEMKFSDLSNPFCGTFDLSKCGHMSKRIRITTNVEEFFKDGGEYGDRLVVLACPFHVVEQAIQLNLDHPFSKILASWDKSKAPIGMFWRWGNWEDEPWFDYVVSRTMKEMTGKNFSENWSKSERSVGDDGDEDGWPHGTDGADLFVLFF